MKSIGVIGGADGPTAIFVAGKIGGGDLFVGIAVAVVIVLLIVYFWRRKKK